MNINRLLVNICTEDLTAVKSFYTSLFDFQVNFDSDWFVQLVSAEHGFEIGVMQAGHELVPDEARGPVSGIYLTFVVDDCTAVCEQARSQGYDVVQPPEMTFYGQLRAIIKDPAGVMVDVSSVSGQTNG